MKLNSLADDPPARKSARKITTLVEQALAGLQREYAQAGQARVFEELVELLWGKDAAVSNAEIGRRLGLSDGATRAALHRLRRRYRERLRAEVTHKVGEAAEVQEELRYLLTVVSRTP
jgi:DNA-directed RNA polymerase specialized sigma24 family protein